MTGYLSGLSVRNFTVMLVSYKQPIVVAAFIKSGKLVAGMILAQQ